MIIIVIGIIVILIGIFSSKNTPVNKYRTLVILGGILLGIIGFATSAIRIIQPGHVGVQILFGEVQKQYLEEGLNFVNPLMQVEEMTVQLQNYTMSSTIGEGQKTGVDAAKVMSKDGLEVSIDLTIFYKVVKSEAPRIYRDIGIHFEETAIRPLIATNIPESAKNFEAVELYAEKRDEFKTAVFAKMYKNFDSLGIRLEDVLIRNIDLPKSVKESIERKITAVQDEQRMEFVVKKEIREAERKQIEASGQAAYQRILDSALTSKVIQYELIQVQKQLGNAPQSGLAIERHEIFGTCK